MQIGTSAHHVELTWWVGSPPLAQHGPASKPPIALGGAVRRGGRPRRPSPRDHLPQQRRRIRSGRHAQRARPTGYP